MTAGSDHDAAIVVSIASRQLRRALRPLEWMTLEEVALDAVHEGGMLLARTSARRIAEQLGLDPGTVNRALKHLRDGGLLRAERETGTAGRFGLSVYVLGPVHGLLVLQPRAVEPHMESPARVQPRVITAQMASPSVERPAGENAVRSTGTADSDPPDVAGHAGSRGNPGHSAAAPHRPDSRQQCPGQTVLDLGSVSS